MARTVTLKGNPLNLEGPQLKAGDQAPDAVVKKNLLESARLSELGRGPRIYSVVPSLDTPVCAQQTKRFNEEATSIPRVQLFTISADLPTAQTRYCAAEGIDKERLVIVSDHKDHAFGKAYGTWIPEVGIDCRAVFVVDGDDKLRYVEYVPEIASHPNYDAVLETARGL
jgi:thioredoxin-dependent peroxiredoxin